MWLRLQLHEEIAPPMTVAPYQLSVDGFAADHFRVHALERNETISEAWWFDVVVTAPAGDEVERAALAQRATLMFRVHPTPRAFYGVVAAVRLAKMQAAARPSATTTRIARWCGSRALRSRRSPFRLRRSRSRPRLIDVPAVDVRHYFALADAIRHLQEGPNLLLQMASERPGDASIAAGECSPTEILATDYHGERQLRSE
jgi:hypothetical protein